MSHTSNSSRCPAAGRALPSRCCSFRRPTAVLALLPLLAIVLAGMACGGSASPAVSPSAGDAVVARVDGEPVTRAEVDAVRAEARLAGDDDDAGVALDVAIGRELVRREAAVLGLVVDQAAVDERLAEFRERLGGEAAAAKALAEAQMSPGQLRLGAEHGLVRERLMDAKFAHLRATKAAVARFYRSNRDELFTEAAAVRLGVIVARTEHLAADLIARLRRGEDFAALARMYSRDPGAKQDGGLLGWVVVASLPDPLAEAVSGVSTGLVGSPVEGPSGWYVLKVLGRRPEVVTPLAEVVDELRAELTLRRRTQALDRWIEDAVGRAVVERVAE